GVSLLSQGRKEAIKRSVLDKGHAQEVQSFMESLRAGGASPIPFESIIATTRATFRLVDSLKLGLALDV
ncbi:MAG: hypothetical protein HY966_06070, partial [Ignavibacteriales bacterium]|nr:hypothetical protein [Ignavibacteriales bacterium]